ncbi:Uncharacterised nucleotidyltransferase [Lachnospiraceae bacterium YSD2013]|nr:Uncharacterised nucleotidyltransferase [Lachnospiraceae bacterium YSD2013]
MNKLYENVFALARAGIWGEEVSISSETDWNKLYDKTRRSKLLPITYKVVSQHATEWNIPEAVLNRWKKESTGKALNQMYKFSEIKKIIAEGDKRNLKLIMFKGIGVASLYPDPNQRYSSDSDILVYKNEQKKAVELLQDLGYVSTEEGAKEHVPVFEKNAGVMYSKIELHDCLWEDYEGKQAEVLESLKLDAEESLIRETFMGTEYYSLGITEHFIYQIFHIVKHLFFEGISLRYFTDISLFANKYKDKIDWKRVVESMKLLHYERFMDCIVEICKEHLNMSRDIPVNESVTEEMKEHLIEDVLGDKDKSGNVDDYETINFLETYFMRSSAVKESKFQQRRKQILPLPSELHERYSYAKKCPILLPIAWVHRIIFFADYAIRGKKKGKNGTVAMKRSQTRLDLMKEFDLMDTDKDLKKKKGTK